MHYRFATDADLTALTRLNRQLIEDEGHHNRAKSDAELEERMRDFLAGDYQAVLFEDAGRIVAYALYTNHSEHNDTIDTIYLRQFFVCRDCRRKGIGRAAIRVLKEEIWPKKKRLTVGVLWHNDVGRAFWQAVGYKAYSLDLEILPAADHDHE